MLFISFISFQIIEHKSRIVAKAVANTHPLWHDGEIFVEKIAAEWSIQTFDQLTLKAWYIPADKSTSKYVIVANGYHSIRERIPGLCYLFHSLGYNVLVPAYRASAESEGKYIGFGWLDRDDYQRWITEIITQNPAAEIALMGISMGGATTMMISGDDLPENVKCFITDCGYDSVWNEIVYNAKHKFHLPAFPLVHLVSFWSKICAGYSYKEASAVK